MGCCCFKGVKGQRKDSDELILDDICNRPKKHENHIENEINEDNYQGAQKEKDITIQASAIQPRQEISIAPQIDDRDERDWKAKHIFSGQQAANKNTKVSQQEQSVHFSEFRKYMNLEEKNQQLMDVAGIQKYLEDLGFNMENCEAMIGLYLLEISSFTRIQFNEFEKAMVKNNCQKVQQLGKIIKQQIPQYSNDIKKFKEFHQKSFQMAKQNDFHTYLPADDGLDILEVSLAFNDKISKNKITSVFIKFLRKEKDQGNLQAFKRDEWTGIVDFLDTHQNSIKEYSDMESWPTLIDNFVEWLKISNDHKDLLQ